MARQRVKLRNRDGDSREVSEELRVLLRFFKTMRDHKYAEDSHDKSPVAQISKRYCTIIGVLLPFEEDGGYLRFGIIHFSSLKPSTSAVGVKQSGSKWYTPGSGSGASIQISSRSSLGSVLSSAVAMAKSVCRESAVQLRGG